MGNFEGKNFHSNAMHSSFNAIPLFGKSNKFGYEGSDVTIGQESYL
jgi:hypothetical protein